jgi:SHS2 domain-containing protein
MEYEMLDHTSEAKFRAYGKTLEEAFANAAKAMFAVMINPKEVKGVIQKDISVEIKGDKKALLYDFLEELIILTDSEGFLLHDVEVQINASEEGSGKITLTAKCTGDKVGEQYDASGHVKAATYDEMIIEGTPEGWMIQVVVDV